MWSQNSIKHEQLLEISFCDSGLKIWPYCRATHGASLIPWGSNFPQASVVVAKKKKKQKTNKQKTINNFFELEAWAKILHSRKPSSF